jgi:hypothetical protein
MQRSPWMMSWYLVGYVPRLAYPLSPGIEQPRPGPDTAPRTRNLLDARLCPCRLMCPVGSLLRMRGFPGSVRTALRTCATRHPLMAMPLALGDGPCACSGAPTPLLPSPARRISIPAPGTVHLCLHQYRTPTGSFDQGPEVAFSAKSIAGSPPACGGQIRTRHSIGYRALRGVTKRRSGTGCALAS